MAFFFDKALAIGDGDNAAQMIAVQIQKLLAAAGYPHQTSDQRRAKRIAREVEHESC